MNTVKKAALVLAAAGLAAGAATDSAFAVDADGKAGGTPGIGTGRVDQVPVSVPVNAAGLGVNVVSLLNAVTGGSSTAG
ncbi:chaplin [Streptomyces sp. MST-110588]|uniref:chaplin n=1 Tax=Streptomyces sp. MST-110588 TaxID=2833628 RepID=UPI001F5D2DF8|nr:chaplin [Streptomyces sp. MST-110588]UNO42823.1 chaplin [Streptomyces sp. MST-110588]